MPDVFQYNEILVISDGTEALLGSLSNSSERFMAWRTIDGVVLDPLGEFNELQTLVRSVLAPEYLLDYLCYFVLFEDDGALVKKIAEQAKEDGATVAIYYESRLAKLSLKAADLAVLDEEVDELAEDKEESTQAQLKSRWAALTQVVGAEPHIASVAADLVAHFEERSKAQSGKAMVVAMSRDICVHLYNEIIKLRPDWHDADPEKGALKIVMTGSASDKALLRSHIYSSQTRKRLEKRFKDPADPLRLVIVRDMWLTGFDAPCVHTLYRSNSDLACLQLLQRSSWMSPIELPSTSSVTVNLLTFVETL